MLTELRPATALANHVPRLRAALAAIPAGGADEEYFAYALFKELDELGETDQAWPALERGLRARRAHQQFDSAGERARVAALMASAGGAPATIGDGAPVPIFVVGVPRSGVGLVSRLLARHPAIAAPATHTHFANVLAAVEADAANASADAIRQRYLALARPAGDTRPFLLDSQPMNFLHVPWIRRAFPEARILHVERDPLDACFSQLARLFPEHGMAIADPRELAEAYREYRLMLREWHARLPGALLDVSYESLCEKPEMVLRVVCAFLGVRFDRAMLADGEPLHAERIGRGNAYAASLPELFALRAKSSP
jgi:hypothetical protein